jgi:hypothetical protein
MRDVSRDAFQDNTYAPKPDHKVRFMWLKAVIKDTTLTPTAWRYAVLVFSDYQLRLNGYAEMSADEAADTLGVSERAIFTARDLLVATGWLRRVPDTGQRTACYQLTFSAHYGDFPPIQETSSTLNTCTPNPVKTGLNARSGSKGEHSFRVGFRVETRGLARGRWKDALLAIGVPEQLLNKRQQPCPFCGGRDRFQWKDYQGSGGFICRQCGNGDGFALLMKLYGWSFKEAAARVDEVMGAR